MKPLRVEMGPWLGWVLWGEIAFCLFTCVQLALAGALGTCLGFVGLIALAGYALSLIGPIEADFEGIRQMTPSGRYEMKWSEVTKAEVTPALGGQSIDIVLHGRNKKMAVPGSTTWRRQGREEMAQFIESQITAWSIPRHETIKAMMQPSKNTRVARGNRRPPISQ